MVVGLLCQLATRGQLITTGAQTVIAWWYRPLQGVVVSAYFVLSWLRGGQTLGMRPWHLRVRSRDGTRPSLPQALIRLAVAGAPVALLALEPMLGLRGALWAVLIAWAVWLSPALFDPRRRALHDIAAGTELRRVG